MQNVLSTYESWRYLYPPRAEVKIPPEILQNYENGIWYAQPKYNGSCAVLFIHPDGTTKLYNRHGEELSLQNRAIDYAGLNPHKNRFMVLCGEYLNKNQRGENGKPFNNCFIIWDILVTDNCYLINTTFETRMRLLHDYFGNSRARISAKDFLLLDHLYITAVADVYRAPTYEQNFLAVWDKLVKVELYEGLVLKRKSGKLSPGFSEQNNTDWQLKCRRATKNYKH